MAAGDTLKTYSGDGVTTDFAIPFAYDDASTEIVVTRAGGAVTYTFPNAATIRLTSPAALAVGDTLTIQRVTNIDNPKVVFKNGSGTTGSQLNNMVTQLIRSAQEVKDLVLNTMTTVAGVWDAGSKRIINLASPTSANDAANKAYVDARANVAGNVVPPVLAEVGRYLKATATGVYAWVALVANDISDATAAGKALLTAASAAAQRTLLSVYDSATVDTLLNGKASTTANISAFTQDVMFSHRNRIINGSFIIDQRLLGAAGNVTTTAAMVYDRWWGGATGATVTIQRVVTSGKTRLQVSGAASNTGFSMGQRIEQLNCGDLAGKSATLSARVQAVGSLTTLNWAVYQATSADTFGTLTAPTRTLISSGSWTISTTEASFKATVSIPGGATNGLEVMFSTGALTAGNGFFITDVQFEEGAVQTPFERRSHALEWMLCYRYYERESTTAYFGFPCPSTGGYAHVFQWYYKNTKRISSPTITPNASSVSNLASANIVTVSQHMFTYQVVGSTSTNTAFYLQPIIEAEMLS